MEPYEPSFKLTINGVDMTQDLAPYLLSLTYTDNLTGVADELKAEFDNSDFKFLNDWYFSPGAIVRAWIENMFCGEFTIDDTSQSAHPHVAEFKAQSAGFSGPIRTKKSFAHFKKQLSDIVGGYANTYGFTVTGNIPQISITTLIQSRESDIHFLHRIAKNYGCICAIKGKTLIFDSMEDIWKRDASKTIHLRDMKSYRFTSSLPETIDGAISVYHDPQTDTIDGAIVTGLSGTWNEADFSRYKGILPFSTYDNQIAGKQNYASFDADYDIMCRTASVDYKKAESTEEAILLAIGELIDKKNKKHTCNCVLPGNQYLVAGNGINIQDVGKRSGYWLIEKSIHKIVKKGGYTTEIDLTHGAATTLAKTPPPDLYTPQINSGGAPQTTPGSIQAGLFGRTQEQP